MRLVLASLAFMCCATVAYADVSSGPKAGEKTEDFKVFGVTGLVEGKEVSYIKDRKDEPTVYLFVNYDKFDRPMAKFMKAVDADSKEAGDKVKAIAVFLTDKPDAAKDRLPKIDMSLKFLNTSMAIFEKPEGPNGWSINTDAHLTVVIVAKGKVTASFAYQTVNDTDAPKVKEEIKKAAK